MKIRHAITAAFIALASVGAVTAASAQGLTRAEVQQQLIQAEENGSRFVSDTSYPDVSPVFAQQFAHQSQGRADGVGAGVSGTSASGGPSNVERATVRMPGSTADCVGPAGFCTPYFGN
ncbi:DUF4148 domain-containing protein [Paraburkholderia caballeronis]|uniref:DUF4148 domain-containing protein n=1 Tax=Paraburkholderia caballeronis TaxID=416943 RepID=A0A1H7KRE6_9BURK|nr:DUF4148 domain-containing protein [Paraburkholderia caballeronis]PXW28133.1 uncharacterized protein DUF4148 [Paraburkholderia caballeronis]PXX03499.1 uncharacterized protein DUF4148 [Paraburkholderia caballeronis]RAK04243.1 uncharacterized protein DUF4148 [Paraburkholderia caballeronis]TDV19286.1 uncharacterized protein DUF4148 [Paraburkholderia caballeronis]TDV21886.1 uncharacterized protein DUF4148 [Paraburkholderia caballeronis]